MNLLEKVPFLIDQTVVMTMMMLLDPNWHQNIPYDYLVIIVIIIIIVIIVITVIIAIT